MQVYDLIIVGAGPCGLACGIEAHQNQLRYLILEKGALAESIRRYPIYMTFFSTTDNIEIGGLPLSASDIKATRVEALQYYRKVSDYFGLSLCLYTSVVRIEKSPECFWVHTHRGQEFAARHLVLATGYFDCPRRLEIPGEDLAHVKAYYDEPFPYVRQEVVIVGGGNSAVGAALDLVRHGARVTMIVRGKDFKPTAKYWLLPDLRNRVKEGKIKAYFNSELTEISPGQVQVRQSNGRVFSLPADFVLTLVGYTPNVSLLEEAGVYVHPSDLKPYYHPDTMESNVEGLYLAGTVVCGIHTEKVFIENGRYDGSKIIKHILHRQQQS
ncbi:MAG: YpdA family putative bacillithiol disulfide reductase [Microscillaceae bacterium]|nr:YpdA family putative bacillithiol disulfide reductase [Microscillaceae bacterium]